jgi:hypothetical protein
MAETSVVWMDGGLEEALQCPGCREVQRDPNMLRPCTHGICNKCYMERWRNVTSQQSMKCPTCTESVDGVIPNIALADMIDLYYAINPEKRQMHSAKELQRRNLKEMAAKAGKEVAKEVAQGVSQNTAESASGGQEGSTEVVVANESSSTARRIERDEEMMGAINDNQTPLHLASRNGHVGVARTLVEAGANKEVSTSEGFKPLHLAAQNGHISVVKMLLEHSANTAARTSQGLTPLHSAAAAGQEECLRALLAAGANKESKDRDGRTPLHLAVESGRVAIARVLLEAGANGSARTQQNETPLILATRKEQLLVFDALVAGGVDVNEKDERGGTCLHIACGEGMVQAGPASKPLSLLLSHLATPKIENSSSRRKRWSRSYSRLAWPRTQQMRLG